MLTLARNSGNDIYMTARGLAIARDEACRRVIVDSIVNTQRGELQFDEDRGIDYFGTVFQNPKYITVWSAQVRKAVKDLDWVSSIKEFSYEFDRDSQTVLWSMTVETVYGDSVSAGNNGRAFSAEKGDGRMGVRWDDIIDKPDGVETVAQRIQRLKDEIAELSELVSKDTLKTAKEHINKIQRAVTSSL